MYDFALATCSYGKTDDGTIDCVEEAHEKSGLHFRWRRLSGDGLIGRGRSVVAYRFGWLWNDSDYMIFLDGDIVFQPDDLVKLVEAMRAGYHVIGGLYPIGHGKRLAHAGIDGKINIDGGIQEVRWLSTGFMGISKEILHYLVDELKLPILHKDFPEFTCYPFFESGARDFDGGIYISEDWDFPLALDTQVLTANFSSKALGDVEIGDTVVGFVEPEKRYRPYRLADVTDTIEGNLETYRIVTTQGEIIATARHPLLASSPCGKAVRWITPERLQNGQRLVKPIELVQNPDISSKDYMRGYLKGIWQGDGTINPRGYAQLEMVDREAIDRAHQFALVLGLPARDIKQRSLNNPNWRPLWGFYCGSGLREICDMPIMSETFARGYLAGMYDAEGSYHKGNLRIAIGDKRSADEIGQALRYIGVSTTPSTRPDGLCEYSISTQSLCHRFWQATLPAISRKISLNGHAEKGEKTLQPSYPEILAVEKLGMADVKCLTTTTGSFIANGFASHNCEKVKSIGEKVYVHTGVKLGHIKTRIVTASEAIQATAAYKQAGDIWTDLSLFLGKPVGDILSGGAATQLLAKEWDKKESVESFYHNNELYLSDLTQFNSRPDYQDRLAPLKEVRGKKVLDFGCGIGTAVFDLAERNTEVVGCDINKAVLDFAEFRRRKLGFLNARFTDELPNLADFDVVVAIDTLEHIEDLHALLLRFGREMKSGAKLYHVDVFGMREQWPMHFEHGDKIDEWLREAGFTIWNQFWALRL